MSIKLINNYFDAWNEKDIQGLRKLIDINIRLKDWEQEAEKLTL